MSMANGYRQSLERHFKLTVHDTTRSSSFSPLTPLLSADPASGKIIGKAPECNKEDTDNAVEVASEAFASYRKTSGRERSKLLRRWYDLIVENTEDLAKIITWEQGKPLSVARGEMAYAASFFEWFSEEAPRNYGDTIQATVPGNRVFTIHEPVGVCGLITP